MSATLSIDELRVGMFIHLDLGWWAHPFALSSFVVSSPEQLATIRSLGLKRLRWSPERSQLAPEPAAAAASVPAAPRAAAANAPALPRAAAAIAPAAPEGGDGRARQRHALAAQRDATRLCQRQYAESASAWTAIAESLRSTPLLARDTAQALTRALLDKMMVDQDMCIRVLAEGSGDRSAQHALNVTVISLLMGRIFGLDAGEMADLGVGALLHDIGKLDLPLRVRHYDPSFTAAEQVLFCTHVEQGLKQAQRMALPAGAQSVIAQHHEMADGSGFPAQLSGDRIASAARIVALANWYDNLCNPLLPHQALTPHEALSQIFAQSRERFDITMLNAFIRMMGVYPPGSLVQLTDDRYALVTSANSSRPLKPRVLVVDPAVAAEDALLLNLEQHPDLGIRRSVRATALPPAAQAYLSLRPRIVYFFEPQAVVAAPEELAA